MTKVYKAGDEVTIRLDEDDAPLVILLLLWC